MKLKNLIPLVFALLIGPLSSSGESTSESTNDDAVELIKQYFVAYDKAHLDAAFKMLDKGMELGLEEGNYYQVCRALYNKGFISRHQQKLTDYIIYNKEALRFFEKSDSEDFDMLVRIHNNIGHAYEIYGLDRMAIRERETALEYARKHVPGEVPMLLYNIGVSKGKLADSTTIDTYFKAIDVARQHEDYSRIAKVHNELGLLSERSGEFDKAREHFYQIILNSEFLDADSTFLLGRANNGLGTTFMSEGKELDKAEDHLRIAQKYFELGSPTPYHLFHVNKNLGETKLLKDEVDSARYYLAKAETYFDRVDSKPEHYDLFRLMRDAHKNNLKDFAHFTALFESHQTRFIREIENPNNNNRQFELQRILTDYDVRVRQIREQERFERNLPTYILISLLVLATVGVLFRLYIMYWRKRNKSQLSEFFIKD